MIHTHRVPPVGRAPAAVRRRAPAARETFRPRRRGAT